MMFWSIVGIITVCYVSYRFIKALGNSIPILELLLLIAGLQWVVGPYIEYRTSFQHFKYYMYVDEIEYMQYAVPAYLALVIVIYIWLRKLKMKPLPIETFYKYSNYAVILVIVGFASDILRSIAPGGLKFIFFLLANFKFVGAILLFFSKKKKHRYVFFAAIGLLVSSSLRSAMFHDLILWGTFFYMFWAYKKKPSFKLNVIILLTGFFMSTIIQAVKSDYRTLVWGGYSGSYTTLFIDILSKRLSGGLSENTEEQGELNVRLNQGWIISAIMEHTPRMQAYADGSTVNEAIMASLLPRFLTPNKKIAGGVENFEKYTGIELGSSTSMGMSLIGEGYANYGRVGGMFFMGIWGCVLGWVWLFLSKKIEHNMIIFFFLPLIFFQVVKAETELVVVLNHLVKSTILVFLFLWFTKKILNLNVINAEDR
ncbi:hypothetical protein DFQ09_101274 [Winogradskyella pacifica]|uniref:Oligosaccharide repeat unit polymerase n=1 Tax=Winogradskyella pacifica TaxID=664642 RepID=A0A3D9N5P5_9FLAO|nr:O-antigen polysaccharide polymerase Wzy [Winogradskyella pacifica]REE27443.1 hypothetical protein DFQ09_101274 [Winogradskyella pacifica]